MPVLGTKGASLDLLIKQGSTFGPHAMTLTNSLGAPINITGATIRCQIKKTSIGSTVISGDFTLTNPTQGVFTFGFSSANTATLTVDPVSETGADSQYIWDMEIQYADGRVYPLVYGNVSVFREVTK
jgi:hypothetical protein